MSKPGFCCKNKILSYSFIEKKTTNLKNDTLFMRVKMPVLDFAGHMRVKSHIYTRFATKNFSLIFIFSATKFLKLIILRVLREYLCFSTII